MWYRLIGRVGRGGIPMDQDEQQPAYHRKKTVSIVILVFMIFFMLTTSGCIKLLQQSAGGEKNTGANAPHPNAADTGTRLSSPTQVISVPPTRTVPVITPTSSSLVMDAAPILTPDPYPLLHATRINRTDEGNELSQTAEFTRIYTLRGESVGLLVNVTQGPLLISFDVNPMYDCVEDPDSCKGDLRNPKVQPYFILTVRDSQTREIVAEDGYGRIYSSQKIDREIKIFSTGQYHLTFTGNYLDVTLSITTGAAQDRNTTSSASITSVNLVTSSQEHMIAIRRAQGGI